MANSKTKRFITAVECCARCKGHHRKVEFKKLRFPCSGMTHYGFCPKNKQPLMLTFISSTITGVVSND